MMLILIFYANSGKFVIIPVSEVIELFRSMKLSCTRVTLTFHARKTFWLFSYYSNYLSVFGLVARYLAIFSSAATLAFSARREGKAVKNSGMLSLRMSRMLNTARSARVSCKKKENGRKKLVKNMSHQLRSAATKMRETLVKKYVPHSGCASMNTRYYG